MADDIPNGDDCPSCSETGKLLAEMKDISRAATYDHRECSNPVCRVAIYEARPEGNE